MGRRRSPQEKKRLSYCKDGRNRYGENDKSSRKNVPRRKRIRHREARHREHQNLTAALGIVDEELAAQVEDRLPPTWGKPGGWRKAADARLGDWVMGRLARRVRLGISAAPTEQARIAKIQRTMRSSLGGDQ